MNAADRAEINDIKLALDALLDRLDALTTTTKSKTTGKVTITSKKQLSPREWQYLGPHGVWLRRADEAEAKGNLVWRDKHLASYKAAKGKDGRGMKK